MPLAPLRDPEFVLQTLADRLGASAPDPAAIAARIGERRTHVVCDNLEHLLPGAARPLAELAAAAPALRLIATSREPLRVQGEAELDLPPLVHDDAVELFCERARAVRPDVTGTAAVAELCDRLDRLPSRWSSRPPGRSCSRRRRSSNGSETGSTRSRARATPRSDTRRCGRRSRGRTTCSTRTSSSSSRGSACSAGAARSRPRRRCAMPISTPSRRCSTRASSAAGPGSSARSGTGCSRRSASSRSSSSRGRR